MSSCTHKSHKNKSGQLAQRKQSRVSEKTAYRSCVHTHTEREMPRVCRKERAIGIQKKCSFDFWSKEGGGKEEAEAEEKSERERERTKAVKLLSVFNL